MGPLDYIVQSIDGWPEYAMLLALFLALHLPLMRRWAIGIFDPLVVVLFTGAMSCTLVAFMALRGDARPVHTLSFALCQLAFYLGLGLGGAGRRRPPGLPSVARSGPLPWFTLCIAAALHLASTLTIWSVAGIPLFRQSRLGAFVGSGGFGVLERLAESSGLITLFCVVYVVAASPRARRSPYIALFVVWYVVSVALSGSKGAFLNVVQVSLSTAYVYTALRFRRDAFWGGRIGKALLALALVFAVAVLATQEDVDTATALLGLVVRIASYADVYTYAYPGGLVDQLQGDNPLVGMFGGFLSTFRLFPAEQLDAHIGLQLAGLVNPALDIVAGPNPQHPVFGYHYFGVLAPLFSLLLGGITATTQQWLFGRRHPRFVGGLVAFLAYMCFVDIAVDFDYALARVASMLIGGAVILVPVLLLHPAAALSGRRSHRQKTPDAARRSVGP